MLVGDAWRAQLRGGAPATSRARGAAAFVRVLPTALTAAAVCLLLLVAVRWSPGSSASVQQQGAAAPGASTSLSGAAYASGWEAAAATNLTRFRNSLLAEVVPTFSTRANGTVGMGLGDWDLFAPVLSCPPRRPVQRYGRGTGDGTKLLCAMGALPRPCVIYSMGSAGNYLFEEAMLASTACEIHTFDCTVDGTSLDPSRHRYHKWCIGSPAMGLITGRDFRSWDQVTATLGHTRVNLLKIDIEGHEYPVLADLRADAHGRVLPEEVSIELHARMVAKWAATHLEGSWQNGMYLPHTPGDMALAFMHLAMQGYGVVAAEVNEDWAACCSEFTLLRVPAAALTAAQHQQHQQQQRAAPRGAAAAAAGVRAAAGGVHAPRQQQQQQQPQQQASVGGSIAGQAYDAGGGAKRRRRRLAIMRQ